MVSPDASGKGFAERVRHYSQLPPRHMHHQPYAYVWCVWACTNVGSEQPSCCYPSGQGMIQGLLNVQMQITAADGQLLRTWQKAYSGKGLRVAPSLRWGPET